MSTIRKTVSKTTRKVTPNKTTSITTTTIKEIPTESNASAARSNIRSGVSRIPQITTRTTRIPQPLTSTRISAASKPQMSAPASKLRISAPPSRALSSTRPSFQVSTSTVKKKAGPETRAVPKTVRITSSKTSLNPSGKSSTTKTTVTKTTTELPSTRSSNLGTKHQSGLQQKQPANVKRFSVLPKPRAGSFQTSDVPSRAAAPPLEQTVREELQRNVASKPGAPARAKGTRKQGTIPPVIETPDGSVTGTHQITLKRTVNRSAGSEYITKHMTGIETDETGQAQQIEMDIQNIVPGVPDTSVRTGTDMPLSEIISTTSCITVGPGIKAKTHSVVYETTKPSKEFVGTSQPSLIESLNPADIQTMVSSEAKEVQRFKGMEPLELISPEPTDYPLKKKAQRLRLTYDTIKNLENSIVNPPISADEPTEEVQPEFMATIMHSEERGLAMVSEPINVYNHLFPEAKDEHLIEVSAVLPGPGPLEKIVVPKHIPENLHASVLSKELKEAANVAMEKTGHSPEVDTYSRSVLKAGVAPKINNIAVKGKRKKKASKEQAAYNISAEEPPWDLEDVQPFVQLVGASPSANLTVHDVAETSPDSFVLNEVDKSFEFPVLPVNLRHISRVQLRGSQNPPWFPGYVSVLPDNIKLAKTPSEVLKAAWIAVQPNIFDDESFVMLG